MLNIIILTLIISQTEGTVTEERKLALNVNETNQRSAIIQAEVALPAEEVHRYHQSGH